MQPILSVKNISKTFSSVKAVDNLSFDVRPGTITGLLGRNGAGKTTCIRMITGIFYPDSGSIEWQGAPAGDSFRDRIGYLPEERGLYKQMNIIEHLLFLAEIKDKPPAGVKPQIEKWLRRFELWDKKDGKIEELSKGNQQKVQLIGTLLHDPELIVLDEPMSGLDPVNVILVRELLRELRREGRTILLSTHQMAEAERLVDEIVLVHQGKVVLSGTLDEVRRTSRKNIVELEYEGDARFLSDLACTAECKLEKNKAEITLKDGADPQTVLESVVGRLKLRRFEIASPSLEEIFVEHVGANTLAGSGIGANA